MNANQIAALAATAGFGAALVGMTFNQSSFVMPGTIIGYLGAVYLLYSGFVAPALAKRAGGY